MTQFQSGKVRAPDPGGLPAPAIGWDYGTMLGQGDIKKYPLTSLTQNYISITLTWDRWVGLTETPGPGRTANFFDPNGDSFIMPAVDTELTNLNLYLMPAGATQLNQAIWASNSTNYNVEHMFFKLPNPGNFEIWVVQAGPSMHLTNYGLAWWGQAAPAVAGVGVNQGAVQRSRVTSLQVTFDTQVTFAGPVTDAFRIARIDGGMVGGFTATVSVVGGVTVVSLTNFTGAETTGYGSLVDGRFSLRVLASQVSANGHQLDGNGDGTEGDDYAVGFFSFYGDIDGDGDVDGSDLVAFVPTLFTPANYNPAFDFDGDGDGDGTELFEFVQNLFTPLP